MRNDLDAVQLSGEARARAIERFEAQMEEWGIVMPAVEPLLLDFGMKDFARIGLIEYWIANELEAGYCGKYLFVFDGQTCPRHSHTVKHETFYIVKGRVRMDYGGTVREMTAGDTLPVEVRHPHSFTGIGPALLLEISKPCIVDDNYFEDPRIPLGQNYQE